MTDADQIVAALDAFQEACEEYAYRQERGVGDEKERARAERDAAKQRVLEAIARIATPHTSA